MHRSLFLLFLMVLPVAPSFGHEGTATSATISLDEKLGTAIPSDIMLRDEDGKPVNLMELADRPLIVAPVYLHCTHVCPMLLNGLADALGKLQFVTPGRDFRVVTLSFDEKETPSLAREKKPNYLAAIGRPFPPESWRFLTGDGANIRKFTDAVGFAFQRDGNDFSHPVVLIVLAPGGKVVRYLEGVTFLPFQVTMALNEAAQGKVGSPAGRMLSYCFSYDPLKKSYVFNILKVVGTVVILTVFSFFMYLVATGKKRPEKR
jgi:protein SCO1/2